MRKYKEDKMNYDSTEETMKHKNKVNDNIAELLESLEIRKSTHDNSKLLDPEKKIFDEVTPKLKGLTYGSPEYKEQLFSMGEALSHHYSANRHHPEHFRDGLRDMNLVDVVEMFCDWCAATERHEDGSIGESIARQEEKLGFDKNLSGIFLSTSQDYKLGKNHENARKEYLNYKKSKQGDNNDNSKL